MKAQRSARRNSLVNVRVSQDEVAGTSVDGKVYAAIQPEVGRTAPISGRWPSSPGWARMRRGFGRVEHSEATAEEVRTAGVPD